MGARPKLLFVLELPFLIFHGGVALIVGNEFRKGNRDFVTSFYILYLAQSAVDCLAYVATGLVGYDLMPRYVYYGAWSNFNLAFCGWCTAFQVLSHVLVAFNRYTAIVLPHRHTLIWKHKNVVLMVLGISFIAFLSILLRVIDKVAVVEVSDGVLISSATAWMRTVSFSGPSSVA
ncbi:hypothetical protein AAVH_06595 [Aphelenchoides avenae]|nr:hypothetical protein AAVH_06595 [Aphelenchus avenae]